MKVYTFIEVDEFSEKSIANLSLGAMAFYVFIILSNFFHLILYIERNDITKTNLN